MENVTELDGNEGKQHKAHAQEKEQFKNEQEEMKSEEGWPNHRDGLYEHVRTNLPEMDTKRTIKIKYIHYQLNTALADENDNVF